MLSLTGPAASGVRAKLGAKIRQEGESRCGYRACQDQLIIHHGEAAKNELAQASRARAAAMVAIANGEDRGNADARNEEWEAKAATRRGKESADPSFPCRVRLRGRQGSTPAIPVAVLRMMGRRA